MSDLLPMVFSRCIAGEREEAWVDMTISVGIFVEIVLMIFFSGIEVVYGHYFGDDRSVVVATHTVYD